MHRILKQIEKSIERRLNAMDYPYVAKCQIPQGEYYVVFRAPNEGVVVGMNFVSDRIKLFEVGDFDETLFTPLEKDECVRISN